MSVTYPWLAAVVGPGSSPEGSSVSVQGWLAGAGARPAVAVTIGGHRVTPRVDRYDGVVPGLPAHWTVWGWRAQADVDPRGQLAVELTDAEGRVLASRDVRADGTLVPAALGHLDNPAPDVVVAGDLVAVTGWLLLDNALPSRIEVRVGDGPPVAARLLIPRPDLGATLPDHPDAGMAGYEARVPVEVERGRPRQVRVRLRAWARDGREWSAPVRECVVHDPAPDAAEVAASRQADRVLTRLLAATPADADRRHLFVVAHSLRIGGGELWLAELLGRLIRDHGMRVTVAAQADGPLRGELEAFGATVRLLGGRRIQDEAGYHGHVAELSLLMRASGAGVALVNTLGFFAGVDAAGAAGLPVAWAIHESFTLPDFAYLNWGPAGLAPVVRDRWLRCLRRADLLVFVADATRELFLPYAEAARCVTIRYGIGADHLAAATGVRAGAAALRHRLELPVDARVLLNVGVTEPRKGHGPLLAAYETARGRHPDTHLVIVGIDDGPYSAALRDRIRRPGLAGHVSLVPITRDPLPWFAAADLFVNCSDVESLPRTLLEAMALRVPVVASDVFGARELISDGESGWLFRPNDLNALTVGLLRALDAPAADRARIASAARTQVEPFLDSAGYAAEFAKVLGDVASSTGGHE
ncbi:MAG: glycosyltransferase [Labedaea sp.]